MSKFGWCEHIHACAFPIPGFVGVMCCGSACEGLWLGMGLTDALLELGVVNVQQYCHLKVRVLQERQLCIEMRR